MTLEPDTDDRELVAVVDSVSKKYCRQLHRSLRYGLSDLSREVMGQSVSPTLRPGEFYAVKNVSFRIHRGETVALLGPNGAGKSTMLKMLNGLIKPTSGSIKLRGKIAALNALGAGFNPVLSGRENAYINGAVLGFLKEEMDERFDELVAFSELEDAIDDPVKTYSTGMKARLGYSIGTFLQPDLLIMDEVLAAGDRAFKLKCFEHLGQLSSKGTAVLIVSHNIGRLVSFCERAIVLRKGETFFEGSCDDGYDKYYEALGIPSPRQRKKMKQLDPDDDDVELSDADDDKGIPSDASIADIQLLSTEGEEISSVAKSNDFRLRIVIDCERPRDDLRLVVLIESGDKVLGKIMTKSGDIRVDEDGKVFDLHVKAATMLRGNFYFHVKLTGATTSEVMDSFRQSVQVASRPREGMLHLEHAWEDLGTAKEFLGH